MAVSRGVRRGAPVNILAGFDPPGGGIKQLFGQMGKKTAPDPPKILTDYGKLYLLRVSFPQFPRFLPYFCFNSSQFKLFYNFWEDEIQNFRRFAPIWVKIDMNSSPRPPARVKNWGRKQVSSTVGVGKETGFAVRILTSGCSRHDGRVFPKIS